MEVVDKRSHGSDAAEARVGALDVVVRDPGRQGVKPLGVGAVETSVGPLGEERLDEPLCLAVGLGPIWTGPLVASLERLDRALEGGTRVRLAVVGQDPLDPDAMAGEPDRGVEQEMAGTAGALVGYVGDIGRRVASSTTTSKWS
jgi:hypothetical protein